MRNVLFLKFGERDILNLAEIRRIKMDVGGVVDGICKNEGLHYISVEYLDGKTTCVYESMDESEVEERFSLIFNVLPLTFRGSGL